MKTEYRLGIDAGGTFTDFVLANRSGDVQLFKVLSTPNDPTRAIRNGLALDTHETPVSAADNITNSVQPMNRPTACPHALRSHTRAKTGPTLTPPPSDSLPIRTARVTKNGGKTGLTGTKGHAVWREVRRGHKEEGTR